LYSLSACCPAVSRRHRIQRPQFEIRSDSAGTRGGKLTYRITAPPKTFNYLVADDEPSILAAFYLMNSRPMEFDHATLKYRAALAESWTFGADRKTVDVKLREGLKFSDGHPITTEDLASHSPRCMTSGRSQVVERFDERER
jgi:ABC-type transport system substrate-binding protein